MLKKLYPVLILLSCFYAISVYKAEAADINITDIKMAAAVDENLMAIQPMDAFPKATLKVFCWFKWQDAKLNTQITARWHYITERTWDPLIPDEVNPPISRRGIVAKSTAVTCAASKRAPNLEAWARRLLIS